MYVGRLTEWKRPDVAIEACIKANKKIVVIGAEMEKGLANNSEAFVRKVHKLLQHKNVTHIPLVKHSKIFDYYRRAKGFIFPTDDKLEAMPQVAMEAAACGTPVFALRNPLSEEFMIEKKTGFLGKTVKELSDLLEKANSLDPRDCRKFAEDNFSRKVVALKYKKLYEKLLKNKK